MANFTSAQQPSFTPLSTAQTTGNPALPSASLTPLVAGLMMPPACRFSATNEKPDLGSLTGKRKSPAGSLSPDVGEEESKGEAVPVPEKGCRRGRKKASGKMGGRWRWDENARFIEALKLFGRHWRKVEEYVGTRTGTQIRSHAQKYFQKEGSKNLGLKPHAENSPSSLDIVVPSDPKPPSQPTYGGQQQQIQVAKEVPRPEPKEEDKLNSEGVHRLQTTQPAIQPAYFNAPSENEQKLEQLRRYTDSIRLRASRIAESGLAAAQIKQLVEMGEECERVNCMLYQFMRSIATEPQMMSKWSKVLGDLTTCFSSITTLVRRHEDWPFLPYGDPNAFELGFFGSKRTFLLELLAKKYRLYDMRQTIHVFPRLESWLVKPVQQQATRHGSHGRQFMANQTYSQRISALRSRLVIRK